MGHGIAIAAALLLGAAAPAPRPEARSVDALAWMAGTWESGDRGRWTEEHWTAPRGGMMMGLSRSGGANGVGEFEYIRIAPGEGGVPTYWASPGGGAATGFALVESGGQAAVFENRGHDYPQRSAYRRVGDTMTATISLADGGKPRSWRYRRAR
ncbi:MAG TPA: DUF6265 family protein [Allosphingosinicella sp.]